MPLIALPSSVYKDEQAKLCVLLYKWCNENAVSHTHTQDGACWLSGDRKQALIRFEVSQFRKNIAYATVYTVDKTYTGVARSADLLLRLLSALKPELKEPQNDKQPARRSPRLNTK